MSLLKNSLGLIGKLVGRSKSDYEYEGVKFDEIGCGDGLSSPIRYICQKCHRKIEGGITFRGAICRKCRTSSDYDDIFI